MSANNAATARAINEAYNAKDWDTAVSLMAPDVETVNLVTGQTFTGPDGARQFFLGWAGAFPDSLTETTTVIAEGDQVAMEFIGRGTQTGPLPSPGGDIPPTGKAVEIYFVLFLVFKNGKVARQRLYFDGAGMMRQLGVTSAPASATAG